MENLSNIDFSNLKYINLMNNKISYKGVKIFLKKKELNKLEKIDLKNNFIDEDDVVDLSNKLNLKKIKILYSHSIENRIHDFLIE